MAGSSAIMSGGDVASVAFAADKRKPQEASTDKVIREKEMRLYMVDKVLYIYYSTLGVKLE